MQKISIKYPVFRNDWSHYKRYFICLGPCFPKKGESRTSWGLELTKDDDGNWQIEANAKYYSDDFGKENTPRIGSINLASLILDEIKKMDEAEK